MMDFASLAVLSYKRPQFLHQSLDSLKHNTFYPHELIVHDDGSDDCWFLLYHMTWARELSTVIINTGMNMGVGEALYRCWACAKGNYLAKLDADLIYQRGWLEEGVRLLENHKDVGALGFFAYPHPNADHRITRNREDPSKDNSLIEVRDDEIEIVHDFVSSAMLIRQEDYEKYGPVQRGSKAFAGDIMLKRAMQKDGMQMAITPKDWIQNIGFGLDKSVVVTPDEQGKPVVTQIAQEPLLFSGPLAISRKLKEVTEE
jgi:GT2 family glycosyltransferase